MSAEAKGEENKGPGSADDEDTSWEGGPGKAPMRLMTVFLRAVAEERMEEAYNLTKAILEFEPDNAMVKEYQSTLTQFINNKRAEEAAQAKEDDSSESSDDDSSHGHGSSSDLTEGDESGSNDSEDGAAHKYYLEKKAEQESKEEARLASLLSELQVGAAARAREENAIWSEDQFAGLADKGVNSDIHPRSESKDS